MRALSLTFLLLFSAKALALTPAEIASLDPAAKARRALVLKNTGLSDTYNIDVWRKVSEEYKAKFHGKNRAQAIAALQKIDADLQAAQKRAQEKLREASSSSARSGSGSSSEGAKRSVSPLAGSGASASDLRVQLRSALERIDELNAELAKSQETIASTTHTLEAVERAKTAAEAEVARLRAEKTAAEKRIAELERQKATILATSKYLENETKLAREEKDAAIAEKDAARDAIASLGEYSMKAFSRLDGRKRKYKFQAKKSGADLPVWRGGDPATVEEHVRAIAKRSNQYE